MNKLRELRESRKLKQMDIAKHLGITSQAYGHYETNKRQPDPSTLSLLADYFNVTVDYLLGRDDKSLFDYNNIIQLPETELIPLVGTIACGTPTLATENIEEYIKADKSIKATFALRCKGDSMINARIFDGDIVYIRQQDDIENSEIAAVLIGEEATLKRVYKYPNRLELRAENPTFPTLNFEGESLQEIRILGKAVAFLSAVR